MVRVATSVTVGVVALALTGCGAGGSDRSGGSSVRTATTSPIVAHVICDAAAPPGNALGLRDLRGLARAGASVAVVRPTGARSVGSQGGIPITIAQLRVVRVVRGRRLPAMLKLRQTGSASAAPAGSCPQLVADGHTYLAVLMPFRLRPRGRQIGGQYVVAANGLLDRGGRTASPAQRRG